MAKGKKKKTARVQSNFTYDGKRYYVYGATLKEAHLKADEKLKELEAGARKRSKDQTFSEYVERWSEAREKTVKGATIRKQELQFKAASSAVIDRNGKHFGDIPLKDLEVQDIRELQKALSRRVDRDGKPLPGKKERSPQTINDIIALVSHVLSDAVNERAMDWNPCKGVKNLKREDRPARETIHRALTEEELILFFTAAEESWYYYLYRFLLASGCRCGEAGALMLSDVKPDRVEIRRTVTKNQYGTNVIGDTPKTGQGRRDIPMTDAIREAISAQKAVNASVFGDVIGMNDTIFRTGWGNILVPANVDRDIERICRRVGMKKFTAHAFRDTFATRCISSGMNPKTLQEILGHADFSVTMNVYAHALDETKAQEMRRVIAIPV